MFRTLARFVISLTLLVETGCAALTKVRFNLLALRSIWLERPKLVGDACVALASPVFFGLGLASCTH